MFLIRLWGLHITIIPSGTTLALLGDGVFDTTEADFKRRLILSYCILSIFEPYISTCVVTDLNHTTDAEAPVYTGDNYAPTPPHFQYVHFFFNLHF